MATDSWNSRLKALVQAVDGRDMPQFLTCFHDDAVLQMGNSSPVSGKVTISAKLRTFLSTRCGIEAHDHMCPRDSARHRRGIVDHLLEERRFFELTAECNLTRIRGDLIGSYRVS